jgi:cytochrome c biogenesis protein CcmG, thiol:disulfide interchange protein DsbE
VGSRASASNRWCRWVAAAVAVGSLAAAPVRAADLDISEPGSPGSLAPDFSLPDTTGKTIRLKDFEGKAILLTFWSCHTDTCFTTVKVFEELLAKLGPLGLAAPTVCEEIPEALASDNYAGLLQRCSTGQTILIDPKREARGLYRVRQLPTSVLIGPDLRIVEVVRGVPALRDPGLHARIEKLVRDSAPPAKAP